MGTAETLAGGAISSSALKALVDIVQTEERLAYLFAEGASIYGQPPLRGFMAYQAELCGERLEELARLLQTSAGSADPARREDVGAPEDDSTTEGAAAETAAPDDGDLANAMARALKKAAISYTAAALDVSSPEARRLLERLAYDRALTYEQLHGLLRLERPAEEATAEASGDVAREAAKTVERAQRVKRDVRAKLAGIRATQVAPGAAPGAALPERLRPPTGAALAGFGRTDSPQPNGAVPSPASLASSHRAAVSPALSPFELHDRAPALTAAVGVPSREGQAASASLRTTPNDAPPTFGSPYGAGRPSDSFAPSPATYQPQFSAGGQGIAPFAQPYFAGRPTPAFYDTSKLPGQVMSYGEPPAHGQPSYASGQPSAVHGQPSYMSQAPSYSGQPPSASGQPSAVHGQPSYMSQATSYSGRPAYGGQPSSVSSQPQYSGHATLPNTQPYGGRSSVSAQPLHAGRMPFGSGQPRYAGQPMTFEGPSPLDASGRQADRRPTFTGSMPYAGRSADGVQAPYLGQPTPAPAPFATSASATGRSAYGFAAAPDFDAPGSGRDAPAWAHAGSPERPPEFALPHNMPFGGAPGGSYVPPRPEPHFDREASQPSLGGNAESSPAPTEDKKRSAASKREAKPKPAKAAADAASASSGGAKRSRRTKAAEAASTASDDLPVPDPSAVSAEEAAPPPT